MDLCASQHRHPQHEAVCKDVEPRIWGSIDQRTLINAGDYAQRLHARGARFTGTLR